MRRPRLVKWLVNPLLWAELLLLANVAFLGLDSAIAHAVNLFAHRAEWIPVIFSTAATLLLALAMAMDGPLPSLPGREGAGPVAALRRLARRIGLAVGWGCIAIGVAGLLFHLQSRFIRDQTIGNLVETVPFVAPLSYAGIGLLAILDRTVDSRSLGWARWVVLLALGGFTGNVVLTLADHTQNGSFGVEEWVGVVASALAVGFLLAALLFYDNRRLLRLCAGVMGLQILVGFLGFSFHLRANLASPHPWFWERFLFGAPVFAPLLFPDLALLAFLGLWALNVPRAD